MLLFKSHKDSWNWAKRSWQHRRAGHELAQHGVRLLRSHHMVCGGQPSTDSTFWNLPGKLNDSINALVMCCRLCFLTQWYCNPPRILSFCPTVCGWDVSTVSQSSATPNTLHSEWLCNLACTRTHLEYPLRNMHVYMPLKVGADWRLSSRKNRGQAVRTDCQGHVRWWCGNGSIL